MVQKGVKMGWIWSFGRKKLENYLVVSGKLITFASLFLKHGRLAQLV